MEIKEIERILDMFPNTFELRSALPLCTHDYCLDDGMNVCKICYEIAPNYVERYIPYMDRRLPSSPYNKMTHFKEKLDELCHSVLIPEEVMELCKDLTNQEDIRLKLHQHRLKKYYSSVFSIMRQKGIPIPTLQYSEKEHLCRLFLQVEHAYIKVRKKTNMLSYAFLLSKLCPMIGRDDLVPYLFTLHSKRKVREYNLLWEKILLLI
jgi:hypothetical protein